ncbi:hypothetical protein E8E13_002081 [Curvularia kusanoi]|uniref:Phosphatidic acid phosphatase type 2/haloperoxidase domain-containing protein n=1 Tax=Curvularia kusanoi TaxID=90978 RepID=A0A9P4W9B3_CURKU|nr:hypothetical protein E8E13_002081 [Curvularia kusanoi]
MPARSPRRSTNDLLNQPGFVGAAARFWQRSYASDYVGLALLISGYIFLQIQFLAEPFHRMFYLSDLRIAYPHALIERVNVAWLFIYAGAVPLGSLVLWALVARPGAHKAHVTLLGWTASMILTLFLTDVVKNAVGRPRPDLLARCKPAPGTPADVLVTFEVCTETNHHTLHDGWRSFPSGHSSFSFSGLGRYYPALRSRDCATPYPNPADEKAFGKLKDEESMRGAQEFELDEFDEEDEERESRPLNGGRR